MTDTFTWKPDHGASVERTPRIRGAKFGDGYEQRQQDGLNAVLEKWTVTFRNREMSDVNDIDAFLLAQGGVDYFTWTAPDNDLESKYICKSWRKTKLGPNHGALEATFEEVADA